MTAPAVVRQMSAPAAARPVRVRPTHLVVDTAVFWLLLALAATSWWPIYAGPSLVVAIAGAAVLGTVVALLGTRRGWPAWALVVGTVVAFLAFGVPLAVPDRALLTVLPSAPGLAELVSGVALGWKQLLTITLPVGSYQALLVPPFTLALVATVVGVSIALRARFGELAVLPPAVVFLVGIAFGPRDAAGGGSLALALPALALVAVSLLWLAWRRGRRRRQAIDLLAEANAGAAVRPVDRPARITEGAVGARTLIAGAVLLVLAAGAAFGAATLAAPTASRAVLRDTVAQPFDPRSYASPLSAFRSYLEAPAATSTMLTVSGLPANARIRIATLDSYDGVVYGVGSPTVDSAAGTFVRIPSGVDQSAVAGTDVSVDVTVGSYSGVWLPTVGQLEGVAFTGAGGTSLRDAFAYNTTTGTAADVGSVGSGTAYTLTARIPAQPTQDQLAAANPGTALVPRLSAVPTALGQALDGYIAGITAPGARLVAAIAAMKQQGYISHGIAATEPASRSGHAIDRINQLFTAPQMIGDAEQYAVAGALMARQLGFPARVVVGFVPPAGASTVTGADISAWVEVDTAEYGWVTVDPVPAVRPIPQAKPQDPTQVSRPQSIVPPPIEKPTLQQAPTPPDSQTVTPPAANPVLAILLTVLPIVGWVLLVLLIVLAPFLTVLIAKVRRRRLRRTDPDVLARIRGGWDEFRDIVVDHGFEPPPTATRSELAATVGTLPSRVLAAVADRAVFAPTDPQPADADHVWAAVDELRSTLDAGLTRRARWRALISVRSLGGYSLGNLFKGGPE